MITSIFWSLGRRTLQTRQIAGHPADSLRLETGDPLIYESDNVERLVMNKPRQIHCKPCFGGLINLVSLVKGSVGAPAAESRQIITLTAR